MTAHSLKEQIRDRIFRLSGKEFQKLVWDILIKVFPDLQTPEMQHDLGNDGYSVDAKTFFAVYAPKSDKYDNKETSKKISNNNPKDLGDYEKFINNWKDKFDFSRWVFVTKENLLGKPHQKVTELNQNGDGIKKEHWGVEQLVEQAMNLGEDSVREIFDLEASISIDQINKDVAVVNNGEMHVEKVANTINEFHQYGSNEEEENTAVDEIFDYVIAQLPQTPPEAPDDDKHIKVQSKIKLNFTDTKEQSEVEKYFIEAYTKTKLIESRLEALDPTTQGEIQLHLFQKYNEFKRSSQSNIEVLDKLFSFFTPEKRKRNSTFAAVVRAFVLLYFEDCTIFEKE